MKLEYQFEYFVAKVSFFAFSSMIIYSQFVIQASGFFSILDNGLMMS